MTTQHLALKKGKSGYMNVALLKSALMIAIPVTLQTLFFSSKGLIDLMMIGQLSEENIAAMGVGSRALFVATILLSGVTAGGAMLVAQFHGARKEKRISQSTALTWLMTSLFAIAPMLLFATYGADIVGLSSGDDIVRHLGHQYLTITGISLLFIAYSTSIAAALRSTHQATLGTLFSIVGVTVNVFLNWVLIFGHLGAPSMGLKGAAIATLIAAGFEALCIFVYLYASKHLLAFKARDLFASLRPKYIRQFWTLSLPTTFNFLVWAGGLFTYTAIMGQANDIGLVALAVMIPIESVALALLVGTANASSVIVGNQIGAKEYSAAYSQAVIFTVAAIVLTLCVAVALYLLRTPILNTFTSLSAEARLLAETFYTILCFGIVLRSLPANMVVGVLRAGGDVRFCLYQDIFTQWFFGIPIAAFCALFIGLPPEVIYATFFLETLFKWVACLYRFRSKKWIHQLAH